MNLELNMNTNLEDLIQNTIATTIKKLNNPPLLQQPQKEWMSLKEGAEYAGVSINTFSKFREMGLKVCEIVGVKRVSRTEIDAFFNEHSY